MADDLGRGRLLADGPKLHDDLRLLGRAMRERWPIDDDFKQQIIDRVRSIVAFNPDDEIALKAVAQVRGMEAQNQKDEHAQIDEYRTRILEIAKRCGIDVHLLGFSSEAGGSSAGSYSEDFAASED